MADESRYVEAALFLTTCNARPFSHHDWHWRVLVAHRFGHAAAAVEFALEGLYLMRRLSKDSDGGTSVYGT